MASGNAERTTPNKKTPAGHLLILACSQRKIDAKSPMPAFHLYDGVNYRVLRKALLERGWPPDLQIRILSAKYGFIDAATRILPYDKRMNKARAEEINKDALAELKKIPSPASVLINLGQDYLPAVKNIERVFARSRVVYAQGRIGERLHQMKDWLQSLKR